MNRTIFKYDNEGSSSGGGTLSKHFGIDGGGKNLIFCFSYSDEGGGAGGGAGANLLEKGTCSGGGDKIKF